MGLQNKPDEGSKIYQIFKENFVNVLDAHALRKAKISRDTHKHHVYKNLCKAMMKRSAFKSK